ncbi:MAG: sialidase family protein [Phycisphaerales bacterium]
MERRQDINRGRNGYPTPGQAYNDSKIGVLYEWGDTSNYEEIRFATFTEQWLDDLNVVQLNFDEQTSGRVTADHGFLKDSRGSWAARHGPNGPTFVEGDPAITTARPWRFTGGSTRSVSMISRNFASTSRMRTASPRSGLQDQQPQRHQRELQRPAYQQRHRVGPAFLLPAYPGLESAVPGIDNSTLASLYSDVVVNDGEWYHVAAVRDACCRNDQLRRRLRVRGFRRRHHHSAGSVTPATCSSAPSTTAHRHAAKFVGDIDLYPCPSGRWARMSLSSPT